MIDLDASENIEFELIMQKNIKDFAQKAKLKEEQYKQMKQKISDGSEIFDSFPPEEEKYIVDMHDSEDTPPFTLKSQFLKNLDSKTSLEKDQKRQDSQENEYIIKDLNTGESYDIRNIDAISSLTSKSKQAPIDINKEKAWQDYWYFTLFSLFIEFFIKKRKIIRKNYEKLWDAAELGDLKLIQELLASHNKPYPLDINAKTLDDWTALHLASNEGHAAIVDILLKNDVNKEAVTKMGRKALHIAAIRGNFEVVSLLVQAGCELDYQDQDLCTPLHYAAAHGDEKILRELLGKKPNTTLKNYQGMTPYDLSQDYKIREIFEEYGIKTNDESGYGRTPYGPCIRANSRADHVEKLLFFGNMNKIKYIIFVYLF